VVAHSISVAQARQIAVRAQLLDEARPADLIDTAPRLTLLQIDPTAAVAPNADLVAWSRVGSSYSPADLTTALQNRTLIELRAMIRPSEDLPHWGSPVPAGRSARSNRWMSRRPASRW
jgi:uncharacterized protein YcaQ